jgi:type III pantothenate kinase
MSSVVPAMAAIVESLVKTHLNQTVTTISLDMKLPVSISYSNNRMGLDRVAAIVGGWEYHRTHNPHPLSPLLIIDAGTSVTFEVVDGSGTFLGGIIASGIPLLTKGLTGGGASQLKLALPAMGGHNPPPLLLGKGTVPCMTSGIVYAFLGTVEAVKRRVDDQVAALGDGKESRVFVIATGGDAPFLASNLGFIDVVIPDLVHRGVVECIQSHEGTTL